MDFIISLQFVLIIFVHYFCGIINIQNVYLKRKYPLHFAVRFVGNERSK